MIDIKWFRGHATTTKTSRGRYVHGKSNVEGKAPYFHYARNIVGGFIRMLITAYIQYVHKIRLQDFAHNLVGWVRK